MTREFDFSTTDILDHNFSFSKMTALEIKEKRKEFETYQEQKRQVDKLPEIKKTAAKTSKPGVKPVFKPRIPKKK